jgi:hypothetical protein
MSMRLLAHGAQQVRDGASPCGQYGRKHQDQKPVIRGSGKLGLKQVEQRQHTCWDVHGCGPSMGLRLPAYHVDLQRGFAAFHHKRSDFPTPLP